MTPSEIMDNARQQYNAVGDTFYSETELLNHIYDSEMQLAREALCIRGTYSTVSVASQQVYSYPTNALSIKRVSYNGYPVEPRPLEEVLNLTSSIASPTGSSYFYAIWNEAIYLAPLPDTAGLTIAIYSFDEPSVPTVSSTLGVPTRYHMDIVQYLLMGMCTKDKNYQGAEYYRQRWEAAVMRAKIFERKMLRGQGFSFVKDADHALDSWSIVR